MYTLATVYLKGMSRTEIPLREARAQIGHLVDLAEHHGDTIVITRHGRPAAMLVPYAEELTVTTTYTLTTNEGTETIQTIRNSEQVREIYTVDGDVCDDSIVCHARADEYLRQRESSLRASGYVTD